MSINQIVKSKLPPFAKGYIDRIKSSPVGYRLAKGSFWSLTGAVISRVLTLGSTIFVARVLGKEGFGQLGMIQSTIGMFGTFAGFGLGLTATKHVAEFRSKDPAKAGRILCLSELISWISGGIITLLLIIMAPWLASHTMAEPHLSGLLRIGSGLLLFGALNGAQIGALSGYESFQLIAKINFLVGILSFPLVIIGVWLGGLPGAVWGLVVGMVLNWLINHIALRKESSRFGVPLTLKGCSQELQILWGFSLPAMLNSAVVVPVNWATNTFLVNQHHGYAEMGVFNAANQWRNALLFLPMTLCTAVLPVLSSLANSPDRKRFEKILWGNVWLAGFSALLPAIMICLLSKWILGAYGSGFSSGYMTLILLSASAVLMAVCNAMGQGITSLDRIWGGFTACFFWAIVLIIMAYSWTKSHGAVGLAWANVASYPVQMIFLIYFLKKPSSKDLRNS